jgi:hypothetical protein
MLSVKEMVDILNITNFLNLKKIYCTQRQFEERTEKYKLYNLTNYRKFNLKSKYQV